MQSPVAVNKTGYKTIALQDGQHFAMSISAQPVFIIVPDLNHLMATVYNSTGEEIATFSNPTNVFAFYFSLSNGSIVFRATDRTTLKCFVVKPPFECPEYFLSTAASETWTASNTGGNFTFDRAQDICFLHVSDNVTQVTGQYDTYPDFDFLEYDYSGARSGHYTGFGSASDFSDYITTFHWHASGREPSQSFSVSLSTGSSLPCRRLRRSGMSLSPIILEIDPVPTDPTGPLSGELPGIIAGIAAGCVVLIVVLVVVLCKAAARKSGTGSVNSYTVGGWKPVRTEPEQGEEQITVPESVR
jgi:hypothetical protein